jgi:hypothetical protein
MAQHPGLLAVELQKSTVDQILEELSSHDVLQTLFLGGRNSLNLTADRVDL